MLKSKQGLWKEKRPLHCLTLVVKSLSYARVTLRERSCPTLCQLTATNYRKLPMSMFIKLDCDFMGIMVPKVCVLITQELNGFLDECHKTKFPGIIGWNLMKLAYEVFKQQYGLQSFHGFDCPTGVNLLLFYQLFLFYHNKVGGTQSDSISISTMGHEQQPKNKAQQFSVIIMGF